MSATNQGTAQAADSPELAAGPALLETRTTHAAPTRFLRLPEVIAITGLRKTKIYELIADGAFPQQVKITAHSVRWVEAEIHEWQACRIALRFSQPVRARVPL
jgi:prophage regulatory protein